jgi:putative alpha-1,2-mannosidase
LSGTGAADLLDFLLMPGTGPAKTVPGSRENPQEGYRSHFSHDDEVAVPGYYSVLLKDYGIHAELSATERAGIHKYTFPKSDTSHFILDLVHADIGIPAGLSLDLASAFQGNILHDRLPFGSGHRASACKRISGD